MVRLSANLQGIALVTLSMAFLTSGDAVIKSMSEGYPPATFMAIPGVGFVLLFGLVARLRGERVLDRRALSGAPLLRSLAEILAAITMISALGRVPLGLLTMILQTMPLIVTLGAVLAFGERVGPRRWIAIVVGLFGVVVILRPGQTAISTDVILAIGAALALSMRDLLSRAVSPDLSSIVLAAWAGTAVTIAGFVILFLSGTGIPQIPASDVPGFLLLVLFWGGGGICITAGMRVGEVSVVAPFRYMRLPMGIALGVVLFGEEIAVNMLIGIGIIVASGLFILSRERTVARARR